MIVPPLRPRQRQRRSAPSRSLHGEYKAQLLRCPDAASHVHSDLQEPDWSHPRRRCRAETLYEAAGIGLARLKKDGWIEGLGVGSRLEIEVREPSTVHSLTVHQLHRWMDSVTTSPAEVLRRAKVKQLLGR